MVFGLFRRKVKMVTVKRKKKSQEVVKPKIKKSKLKKPVVRKIKTMPQAVGKVTHYFPHVKAGVIKVSRGQITLGDTLQIKGHTTDFKQKVNSIQIDNAPIKEAKPGQEIGLLVKSRVRHNDVVYKL